MGAFKPPAVSEMVLLEPEDLQGFSNSLILILGEPKGCRRAENTSEIGSWTHSHSPPGSIQRGEAWETVPGARGRGETELRVSLQVG